MEISCVVADRLHAPGLNSNWAEKVLTFCIDRSRNPETFSDRLLDILRPRADLIVLAGFLSILDGSILKVYEGRILNIHPALLPKFGGKGMYGIHVHRAVVAAKEQESGCTVHWVTRGIDSGPIILQRKVFLSPDETPESLQQKVRQVEGPALAAALIQAVASWSKVEEGGCQ
jgi:phosphoribosylglycinamide formyltransferase-1